MDADTSAFWSMADELVASTEIVIDRPRGSWHPYWSDRMYPLAYRHLANTRAGDGAAIDVWRGSLATSRVTGAIVTIDLFKGDAEVTLLVGCTGAEAAQALAMHIHGAQAGLLLERDRPPLEERSHR